MPPACHEVHVSRSIPPACLPARVQKSASWGLLDGVAEGQLTILVKDFIYVERVFHQLHRILKRDPTVGEWSSAMGMDVMSVGVGLWASGGRGGGGSTVM